MLRHIPLGELYNLRDLGGYPGAEGKTTAWERFLRADAPKGLSEADVRWLLDRKITTLIDLRSPEETERVPNQLAAHPAFRYHHCPLMGGEGIPPKESGIGSGYFATLDRQESVRSVLRLILDAPGGVLFHCMVGKDRTGMIAMLLLSVAGVGRADILADYQVSETYLLGMMKEIRRNVPDMPAYAGWSRRRYMETCLRLLEKKYGSVPGYLKALGFSDGELSVLRGRLLE